MSHVRRHHSPRTPITQPFAYQRLRFLCLLLLFLGCSQSVSFMGYRGGRAARGRTLEKTEHQNRRFQINMNSSYSSDAAHVLHIMDDTYPPRTRSILGYIVTCTHVLQGSLVAPSPPRPRLGLSSTERPTTPLSLRTVPGCTARCSKVSILTKGAWLTTKKLI